MTFHSIVENIKRLQLNETRNESPDYFESVIHKNNFEQLNSILESSFGPSLKPTGQKPSRQASMLAMYIGGIRQEQTLHYFECGTESCCAAQWPWSTGEFITVRVKRNKVQKYKTAEADSHDSFMCVIAGLLFPSFAGENSPGK